MDWENYLAYILLVSDMRANFLWAFPLDTMIAYNEALLYILNNIFWTLISIENELGS